MSDPYAETDEWPTPSLSARPATHGPEQPVSGSTVTGDAEGAREARYAEARFLRYQSAVHEAYDTDTEVSAAEWDDRIARAVVAVADEEQAALRRTVDGLQQQVNGWFARAEAAEDRLRKVALGIEAALQKHDVKAALLTLRAVLAAPPAAPEAAEWDATCVGLCGHGKDPGACPSGCTVDLPAPVSSGEAGKCSCSPVSGPQQDCSEHCPDRDPGTCHLAERQVRDGATRLPTRWTHIIERNGLSLSVWSCLHHQANLRPLCHDCHVTRYAWDVAR